jgi:hypothetical protein
MTVPLEFWILAAGMFPIFGAVGSLAGILFPFPIWSSAASRLGLFAGILCSAVLAFLLYSDQSNALPSIQVSLWTWFSMTSPRLTSMDFGLEATWIKACLVSLFGAGMLTYEFYFEVKGGRPLSENVRVVESLLYVAVTSFLYAPNLAQSLLGWLAISLLVGILIRLSRESDSPHQTRPVRNSNQSLSTVNSDTNPGIRRLAFSLTFVERFVGDRIWRSVTKNFPDWIGEQIEVIEKSTFSFQVLATILGSFAMLLTWLIAG